MAEIDNAIKVARSSYRRVGATREARQYAEAALEAEEEKLANGKSTSFEVLRLQRDLTQARSAEIGALTEYNKALATVAQTEGTTLRRHRIEFEEY
jgi:outer membrane protein TolC